MTGKALIFAGLLAAPSLIAAAERKPGTHDVRFQPVLMDAAGIQPFRHRLDFRLDLGLDSYKAASGTETLKGLFTRVRPSVEYRYAAGETAELFVRAPYTSQTDSLSAEKGGERLFSRHSAGFSAPTFGAKIAFTSSAALQLHTTPPTAAERDPRLGDGTHYGGALLFHAGSTHLAVSHVVRLPYDTRVSSAPAQRDAGDVTELAFALTRRDAPNLNRNDYVGPLFELHGVYADRDQVDGEGVPASSSLTGKAVFGFVLGKINRKVTHLTQIAVQFGFGDVLHKTEDPLFGAGDLQLVMSYAFQWGRTD
jgi:hypothetical protein